MSKSRTVKNRHTGKAMDHVFALFNCHCNNARIRARKAYIKKFGRDSWDDQIKPYWKKGIMSIFNDPPTDERKWYVDKVHELVNEHTMPAESDQ